MYKNIAVNKINRYEQCFIGEKDNFSKDITFYYIRKGKRERYK